MSVLCADVKTAKQGPVGKRAAGVELPLIQAGEEEEEDMKIAFQHASGESVRPVLVLFVFGQHLVHEVREEFLVGRGQ